MAQTAVEYLIQEIKNDVFVHSKSTKEWNSIFQQAKAMEKEQIIKAHGNKTSRTIEQGCDVYVTKTAEQYYNETYNK
jgi:hypothetical protein